MDKQFLVLASYKDKGINWHEGEVILLDPELAVPYIGVILTPLYSAIKAGLYPPLPQKPLAARVIAQVKDALTPDEEQTVSATPSPDSNDVIKPEPSKKKLLQNKLQAQILAKKAEMAKEKA